MRIRRWSQALLGAGVAALLAGAAVHAVEQTVLGKSYAVKDPQPGLDATKRSLTVQGKELLSDDTVVGDPLTNGATIEIIANGTSPGSQVFTLVPGARPRGWTTGWTVSGVPPASYSYKDTLGLNGPVKSAQVKRTRRGTFTVKATVVGKLVNALGAVSLLPPNPGTDGGMIFTVTGGDTYCVRLGGTAGGLVSANDVKGFKIKATELNPTAEAGCPTLCAATSGTYCDLGDTTILDTASGLQWETKTTPFGSDVNAADLHDVDNRYTWAGCCELPCTTTNLCQPNAAAEAACRAQTLPPALWASHGCNQCGTGTCTLDPGGVGGITTAWDWLSQVNAANYAGHSDWRLPTSAGLVSDPTGEAPELESILDMSVGPPRIDALFGPTAPLAHWTASTWTSAATHAWDVNYSTGVLITDTKSNIFSLRAVRTASTVASTTTTTSTSTTTTTLAP